MNKDNGGPAFPLADSNAEYMNTSRQACNGMTLRDYFAAKAMPSLLNERGIKEIAVSGAEGFAQACYLIADAMLAERAK